MTYDELKDMTADQLEQLLEQKRAEERQAADKRRRDYEETRADFVKRMATETRNITGRAREFYDLVVAETDAFRKIMQEYGATRRDDQFGYSVQEGDFRLEVKCNRIKRFDERADAAARLIEFLKAWIGGREKGADDPMYQLAMTLLERNRKGDLDYKSISDAVVLVPTLTQVQFQTFQIVEVDSL